LCYFGLGVDDKNVQASSDQKRNPGKIIENQDAGISSESKAQKGDKNEIQSLSLESVHESKVLAHIVVERSHWRPPHEFVNEQQDREQNHVKGQEGFAEIVSTVHLIVVVVVDGVIGGIVVAGCLDASLVDRNEGEDTESGHHYSKTHVQQAEHAEETSSLSGDGSLSVLSIVLVAVFNEKGIA